MKENGKGGKGQESSGLVGCGFVVIVQASQLRVGNHLTVKAFEYEGMERLANLRSNWIKEGPEVNVVLSHPVYHIQYCYLLYRSHAVSTRGSRPVGSYLFLEEREC